MNQQRLWIAAAIIAFVVIIGFVLSVPHTRDLPDTREARTGAPAVPPVTLRDVFKKGVHTITGSLTAPNACATASATASLQGSSSTTQSIAVDITMPADTGVCLELPTRISFETSLTAPARLPFLVTVNGEVASTTLQ